MQKTMFRRYCFQTLLVLSVPFISVGCAQRTFSSPDQAMDSLVGALRAGDQQQLREILGTFESEILSSGDKVADRNNIDNFLEEYDTKHAIVPAENNAFTVVVGSDEWPLPIPIVKDPSKGGYRFDTAAGKDEIINRRIGRNELDTIQVCLTIVDAQREFAMADPDHHGLPTYAQKFFSDPGHKNGLYWATAEGEPESPLGPLVAAAAERGYSSAPSAKRSAPRPYLGYRYRMLTSQGPNAKGGARDYLVGKEMLGGFAIVASPAEYGSSGIMTFIVNQDGVVYQRDLGPDTEKAFEKMKAFDPDDTWEKIDAPEPGKT